MNGSNDAPERPAPAPDDRDTAPAPTSDAGDVSPASAPHVADAAVAQSSVPTASELEDTAPSSPTAKAVALRAIEAARTSSPAPAVPDPLQPAIAAMERGDHVEARRVALALRDDADVDATVRQRAGALLDQQRVDPVIVGVMLGTLLLIVVLAALYLGAR